MSTQRIELIPRDTRRTWLDWMKTQIEDGLDKNAIMSQAELIVRLLAHFDQDLNCAEYKQLAKRIVADACKELRDEIEEDADDPWRVRTNTITVIGSANSLLSHKAYRDAAEAQIVNKPGHLATAFQANHNANAKVMRDIDTSTLIIPTKQPESEE